KVCGYTGTAADHACPRCDGEMYQRDDDKPQTIRQRLAVYEEQTLPLIAYYQERGLLNKVDGDRPVDVVYSDVKDQLGL
ncbi:MAG: adenylate kinase, partial [Atopobium minutum]|nr:adenylate kinase [Atopobium minutum]